MIPGFRGAWLSMTKRSLKRLGFFQRCSRWWKDV
jgi:hypothetical protein